MGNKNKYPQPEPESEPDDVMHFGPLAFEYLEELRREAALTDDDEVDEVDKRAAAISARRLEVAAADSASEVAGLDVERLELIQQTIELGEDPAKSKAVERLKADTQNALVDYVHANRRGKPPEIA